MKKIMQKIHRGIINIFTALCGIVFLCAASVADAENVWISIIVLVITGGWLVLYAYAHGLFEGWGEQ